MLRSPPMRQKKLRQRKATKKTRIERLNERYARLRKEIKVTLQKIEAIAKRDNEIRAEYREAIHRWGCVAKLAAKYGLHRSAVHRIIKRKNVEIPGLTASGTGTGSDRAQPPNHIKQGPSPVSAHGRGSAGVPADWIRALNEIRDFAARSSEPRIAQLLDSVIREIKGKKHGGR
jgi:hypothetical protein